MSDSAELYRLEFHAVDQDRWPDFERLFESRGAPKFCWCKVWRATPEEAKHRDGASRKIASSFALAGFCEVGRVGKRCHVMQLKLAG